MAATSTVCCASPFALLVVFALLTRILGANPNGTEVTAGKSFCHQVITHHRTDYDADKIIALYTVPGPKSTVDTISSCPA